MENILFQIRLTGVLIEENRLLLVKQKLKDGREWSLPGGRLEHGETIAEGMAREIKEETGLEVRVKKLLYVCDKQDAVPPLIHMTFLLEKLGGTLTLPTNAFDKNPISDVQFVQIKELSAYGFSKKFQTLAEKGFPGSGSYMGAKANIGL
jgi:ADP-ribose pyrophosphatase YjhB (NUDIX family)